MGYIVLILAFVALLLVIRWLLAEPDQTSVCRIRPIKPNQKKRAS